MKKYRTEAGTEAVSELFSGKRDSEIFLTSFLTLVETTSVAARLLRARSLTQRAYRVMMGNLSGDIRETVRLHSVADSILSEAVNLTLNYALRAPDAIHLSTALAIRATFTDDMFFFMGSDARLNSAGGSAGLTIFNPEGSSALYDIRSLREASP